MVPEWATPGDESWYLQRVAGGGPDRIYFNRRSHVTVGRSSKASEQLQSVTCSGLHAIIAFRRGQQHESEHGVDARDRGELEGKSRGGGGDQDVRNGRVCLRDLSSMHGTWVHQGSNDGMESHKGNTDASAATAATAATRATSDTWTVIALGSIVTFGDRKAGADDAAKYRLCREP